MGGVLCEELRAPRSARRSSTCGCELGVDHGVRISGFRVFWPRIAAEGSRSGATLPPRFRIQAGLPDRDRDSKRCEWPRTRKGESPSST